MIGSLAVWDSGDERTGDGDEVRITSIAVGAILCLGLCSTVNATTAAVAAPVAPEGIHKTQPQLLDLRAELRVAGRHVRAGLLLELARAPLRSLRLVGHVRLGSVKATLQADRSLRIALGLSRSTLRAVRAALRSHRDVQATIAVEASAPGQPRRGYLARVRLTYR